MDYEKKQRLIALCNRMTEYGYTDGVEELESIFPQLAESEEENRKNNHGYYKNGKFWKASTLWEAVKGKIPQRVENRYVLQNCSWNIGTLREFAEEMRDVQEVSLDYPIILDMNGNILDGAHRVVKAYLEGKDIDIVYLGDDEWPEPDYDEEKAVKESKDKKIRGCIGIILTDATEQRFTDFGVSLKDCLAWLEKQKEQKSEKLDGKALLHTADKSYEIGYRDGKMDAQKEMEIDVKDYRLRDTWEYIDEFIKKFGRVPKDIDELSACVDYVIKHKSIDEKEQKPVKYISDSAWQKVKRAITDCKKLSEHYEDTKENFHQYYGGKAEGLQLALDYFGNENELPGQKPAEYSNEEEYLDSELRAFLRNYDKEYDDDPAVSDVAKHFYEIGKRRLRQEWSDETKQECGSIDVSGSIKTSRIKTLENLLSYLKYERKTTQEEINTSFIPCLENLLKDTENMNDHVEWNNATINGEPIPTENQSVDISLANWSEEDKEALDMCYELLLKAEYTLIDKGYFGSVQFIKDWLKSLPERFNLEPKQEWNEDYTRIMEAIEGTIKVYGKTQGSCLAGYDMDTLITHLKKAFTCLENQKTLFNSGAGLYYYNDGKVTYISNSATADNPYDFAMTQQETQKEQKPTEWSFPYGMNETVDNLIAIAECLEMDGDCLFGNGHTGTECGKFLRDLAKKQVECKPVEWSEEDAKVLNDMIVFVSGYADKRVVSRWTEFLKSLRSWTHWKPSEEQMEAFNGYIKDFQEKAEAAVGGWNNFDAIIRLYEQLKKLM